MADGKNSRFGWSMMAALILFALLVIGILTCTTKVPADKVGVRTLLTSSGVEDHDYPPGYVITIPGFHQVHLWDITWTNLRETLQVRGSDQYTTTVDISIMFRIKPGCCHVVAKRYRDEEHINKMALNILNKYANEILAQMKTEDFYNTKIRNDKSKEAQEAMDKQLSEEGLEVKNVLLRNIVYDQKFETQLLQKQLAGQRKSLEMAKGQLAGAQTETLLIARRAEAEVKSIEESKVQEIANLKAETDRKIVQITQDAKLKEAEIVSKAESARRQNLAQADLLKATAAAKGTELLSRVYARPGAPYYFARKALEGIKLGDVEVNSNIFNPIDTNALLKALGVDLRTMPAQTPPPPLPPLTVVPTAPPLTQTPSPEKPAPAPVAPVVPGPVAKDDKTAQP
jgi:hypothetical protein